MKYTVRNPIPENQMEALGISDGYNPEMAISDIIDNSIFANCENIWIDLIWKDLESIIVIKDDGFGMNEKKLEEAMTLYSTNARFERDPKDLGRWGLGMKTASFSMGNSLTAISKKNGDDIFSRRWDKNHVIKVSEWQLLHEPSNVGKEYYSNLKNSEQGTIILIEKLVDSFFYSNDHIKDSGKDYFQEIIRRIEKHISVYFHRFLKGKESINIYINGNIIEPWDPFLLDHEATQILSNPENLPLDKSIKVQMYVLPHLSKLNDIEYKNSEGLNGWNAQQGFYVYRNRRMIINGGWLGLNYKLDGHYQLARIQLDLSNINDYEWRIDQTKSIISPPKYLINDLKRYAEMTRKVAERIQRGRLTKGTHSKSQDHINIWRSNRDRKGRLRYKLKRNHPIINSLLKRPDSNEIRFLLSHIEETVPTENIWIEMSENQNRGAIPFDNFSEEKMNELINFVYDKFKDNFPELSDDEIKTKISQMHGYENYLYLLNHE